MTGHMEQAELEKTLQFAGKTISLAGIVIGLVLLVLLNTGTSLETMKLPAKIFGTVGLVAVAFGIIEILAGLR